MTAPVFSAAAQHDWETLLTWRRDVRHFLTQPLPEGVLETLLHATCLAPSVGLSEPWRFVRINTPERRAAIRQNFIRCNSRDLEGRSGEDAHRYATLKLSGLDEAPHHIAVFCDKAPAQGRGLGRATMPETTTWSAMMAIHTFWLTATVHGVGVGWVSILDPAEVTAALSIDPDWQFLAYLCVGYAREPASTPELERRGWERRNPARRRWIER
jgi:5,6-dimethylbenzimidazole synthase